MTDASSPLGSSIQRAQAGIENATLTAPSITSPTEGSFVTLHFPEIQGTASPGDTITVFFDGEDAGMTSASAEGLWTFVPGGSLSEGSHTVTAIASRDGEPDSGASAPVTFTIDTIAPARPVVSSPSPGDTITVPRPTFTGTGEPETTMLVSIDGAKVGEAMVSPDGTWSYEPMSALINGSRLLSFRGQDAAGNTGLSRNVTVTVDVPIDAPVVTSPADGSSFENAKPTVTGTAEPDAVVTIYIDGEVAETTTADTIGAWNSPLSVPLSAGTHTTAAVAENASGAVSAPSTRNTFTIMAPAVENPPAAVTPPQTSDKTANPKRAESASVAAAQLASTGNDTPVAGILAGSLLGIGGLALYLFKRLRRYGSTNSEA